MGIMADIFKKIAERFGLEVQEKKADKLYSDADDVNLTAVISNRVATITMLDSEITIEGDNARAIFMREFVEEYVNDRMHAAAEVALGTGDCLVKPWTDGEHIGVDIIENEDFRVCESVGNFIRSVIIRCGVINISGKEYQRFEGQRLDYVNGVPVLFIDQFVYCDGKEITNQNAWPAAWRDIAQSSYIANATGLLFGRYKCPTVNREDVNSTNGVKITYGLDSVMNNAAEAYKRFNEEQRKGESMLFADRTLFTADENGTRKLPKGKSKLFQTVKGRDSKELVHEFAPDLRADGFKKGIEVNFKMLELLAGFSNGILTSPTTSYATATEIKASLNQTFAFMTKFRKQLVKGTNELLRAVDMICNRNNITPMGAWDVKYDWSSSYIENMEEQFDRLMQLESIGAVDKAEPRAWALDESIEEAREAVENITNAVE